MKIDNKKVNLYLGAVVAAAFLYLSFFPFSFIESLEKPIYDIEMRLDMPRNPGESRVSIVNIDEKSIRNIGQWPWPRHIIAEMLTILKSNGAKLIGTDIVFSEKEQNEALKEFKDLYREIIEKNYGYASGKEHEWILARLKEIETHLDNDRALFETVRKSGNIILPVLGTFGKYDTELVLPPESFLNGKTIKKDKTANVEGISVREIIAPFPELSKSSRGLGHINFSPSKLMIGKAHIPFINFRGHLISSMPLSLALHYLDKQPGEAIAKSKGLTLHGKPIPTTSNGEILIKFRGGRQSFPYYSFTDILNVKKVPAVFEGKIVLIGYTATGGVSVDTPVDPSMPRVEFMANVIEDFLHGRFLTRPEFMVYVEALILILLGMASAFFNSQFGSLNRAGITAGLIFLVFLTAVITFTVFNVWFKTIYIILTLAVSYGIIMVKDLLFIGKETISKDAIETNRMLGISLQSQGLLDLAFEKFRKCPLNDEMRDLIYNLGLDYERKRMINKAVSIYEYIDKGGGGFKDLNERIPKLKKVLGSLPLGAYQARKEEKIVVSDDLEVKPTVGRYEILMELGKGAMGTVYKGRDPKINRLLAIKTIRFSDEFEENQLQEIKERFFREAELAGKLSHPGIVAIYDVGEDYDLTYMAMEFLDGEDLDKYCRKNNLLTIRKILDIIAETADALEYAHSNGVIHRDIKPANIMLLRSGRIKVTDFGIAKSMSSSKTRSGIILGTPNYMSPEQIMARQIDARSDIFSLGVVFFQLLTGELPFKGENLNSLFYQITQAKHPSPRTINQRVVKPCEQIIDKVLAKNPDHRFQTANDLARYIRILAHKIDVLRAQKAHGA
jgi:CHASE2 domain-containing sensor protein/tRNA A-37 threonylcarbamoyl transferase component Bud32